MLSENANPIRLHAIKFNLYNILENEKNEQISGSQGLEMGPIDTK